jgi:hypothetical protein
MADSSTQNRSVYRLRWIGYGLLIFFLIDALQALIPPKFGDPAWDLQTIGNFIERVVVPLLGLALVFFGEYFDRGKLEPTLLKIISWLCLLLSILFFLMGPLSIVSATRINNRASATATQQLQAGIAQLDQIEKEISRATPDQLKKTADRLKDPRVQEQLKAQGIEADIQNPQQLKSVFLSQVGKRKAALQAQFDDVRSGQQASLAKNAVKWALGALISSVLFFLLWKSSDWAR